MDEIPAVSSQNGHGRAVILSPSIPTDRTVFKGSKEENHHVSHHSEPVLMPIPNSRLGKPRMSGRRTHPFRNASDAAPASRSESGLRIAAEQVAKVIARPPG